MPRRGSRRRRARLVIVDDHDLARAGLSKLLHGARDLEVIAEASSAREALNLCLRLRPDLVLMDVRLPDMDGLAATRLIRQAFTDTRVLLVTMYESADYVAEASRAGAAGYLLKGSSQLEVLAAVRHALRSST